MYVTTLALSKEHFNSQPSLITEEEEKKLGAFGWDRKQ